MQSWILVCVLTWIVKTGMFLVFPGFEGPNCTFPYNFLHQGFGLMPFTPLTVLPPLYILRRFYHALMFTPWASNPTHDLYHSHIHCHCALNFLELEYTPSVNGISNTGDVLSENLKDAARLSMSRPLSILCNPQHEARRWCEPQMVCVLVQSWEVEVFGRKKYRLSEEGGEESSFEIN